MRKGSATQARPSQVSTSSRTRDRTAHKPAEPFTTGHFRRYARLLVLDNGEYWDPEPFQLEIVDDLFARFVAVWTIIPEANGKTTLMGGVGLYWADFKPAAEVLLAAASRQQAELMYGQAAGFVRRTLGMRERFRPYDGYRRIKSLRLEGRIQVMAADDATGDGVLYDLALIDELHRATRGLKLYRTWKGKAQKRGGTIGVISTAGEPGGEFEDTRANIIRSADEVAVDGFHTRAVNGETVLHDYSVPASEDVGDMAVVKRANPFSGITEELLRRKHDDPSMTPEHWRRFVCNQATLTGGSAIDPDVWDALAAPGVVPVEGAWRAQFVDLGWKIDTTGAGVLVWESPQRRVLTGIQVLLPPVDEMDVVAGILRRQIDYGADRVVLDPSAGAEQMVQLLEKGLHPLQTDDRERIKRGLPPLAETFVAELEFVAHSQDNAPMSQAAARFDEAVRGRWFVHDGDRRLRQHVLNAVTRSIGDAKWKFDRPNDAKGDRRRRYPIDLLTGVLCANNVAVDEAEAPSRREVVFL